MGIARKKHFKIHLVLVIKENSSIYVSKELRTQHGWPLLFVVGVTQQIPYSCPSGKVCESGWISGHPIRPTVILLLGCSSPSSPLSCATGAADSYALRLCDLWIMRPAEVTLLGSWLATALDWGKPVSWLSNIQTTFPNYSPAHRFCGSFAITLVPQIGYCIILHYKLIRVA
jgi:hypothetical protein